MKRKLKVGVIGLGVGKGHAKCYIDSGLAEVVGICDVNMDRLEATGRELGIENRFTDHRKLLEIKGLEAVSVALPNAFHAPVTIDALNAGVHVLCEKPMAMNVSQAVKMNETAKKNKKFLMINFSYRFTPQAKMLKKYVDDGVVGKIYYGRTTWYRNRGIPGFGSWFGQKSLSGGGPLIDLGVHRIDLALWLMGHPEPATASGAVYDYIASGLAKKSGKKFDVEDLAVGMVKFKNGATLLVDICWASNTEKKEDMETVLFGTKGGLVHRNVDEGYQFEMKIFEERNGILQEIIPKEMNVSVESSMVYFARCVLENRKPEASGEHGIAVQRILDGIYKSAELGKEIKI